MSKRRNGRVKYEIPEKNSKGRKPKYLTEERFERFVGNEFWHVKQYSKASLWISLAILVAIIARFIMG